MLDRMLIANEWVTASDGATLSIVDPATEDHVGTVPRATAEDVARALAAAAAGFAAWRETDAWTRSRVLREAAGLLRARRERAAAILTEEQGKPLGEARAEVSLAADHLDWFADEARRIYGRVIEGHSRAQRLLVLRQPVGPVAAFTPWNFPSMLAARKIAPAVAAGCAIIVKPAEEAPRSCLFLAEILVEAGLPPGVLGVITGDPDAISERLIASPVIRKISLTASVPVGRRVAARAGEHLKPCTLELGGHAPVLVFADADVERAAEACARGKFRNNGQVCIAASRFYVEASVAERFTARFVEVVRGLKVGDGRLPDTDVGPLANPRRVAAARRLIDDAVAKGARVLVGGGHPAGKGKGFFFSPTVLLGVDAAMAVMREEPFCPVAPITTFSSLDEGLALANASDFGLASYVFTSSTRTAFLAAERLDTGMVGINTLLVSTAEAPFGGVKDSGFGREGGSEWAEAYTVAKYVNVQL